MGDICSHLICIGVDHGVIRFLPFHGSLVPVIQFDVILLLIRQVCRVVLDLNMDPLDSIHIDIDILTSEYKSVGDITHGLRQVLFSKNNKAQGSGPLCSNGSGVIGELLYQGINRSNRYHYPVPVPVPLGICYIEGDVVGSGICKGDRRGFARKCLGPSALHIGPGICVNSNVIRACGTVQYYLLAGIDASVRSSVGDGSGHIVHNHHKGIKVPVSFIIGYVKGYEICASGIKGEINLHSGQGHRTAVIKCPCVFHYADIISAHIAVQNHLGTLFRGNVLAGIGSRSIIIRYIGGDHSGGKLVHGCVICPYEVVKQVHRAVQGNLPQPESIGQIKGDVPA